MSTKLTGYVWDGCAASGMKLSSVAIMARLADFSNDEGVCWPSIETIARQIGAGMSTVRTAIARLEAEGWLTRKARRQGNASVTIHTSPAYSANKPEGLTDGTVYSLYTPSEQFYPPGAPIPWPSDTVPSGYALMQGQTFDKSA